MARGGKRPGAGRPKGTGNKVTEAAKRKALEDGISPLDYMLSVLRDEGQTDDRRMDAAKAAAPYIHPRLATTEVTGKDGDALVVQIVRYGEDSATE